MSVNLSNYDKQGYDPGGRLWKRSLWYALNALLFNSWLLPGSTIKCWILRLFGATIGIGVRVKPRVNIKYPWFLAVGDHVWIGEGVWIDNLTWVRIGSNVCLSQGAYLLTGNHDYKDPAFKLILGEIRIDDGVWIGAQSIVCPGLHVRQGSVLTVASVLHRDTEPFGIYTGNPAARLRDRKINDRSGTFAQDVKLR